MKKAKGQRVGAVPLGYRLSRDGTKLEPAPREQKAIALAHELREIDKELRRRGFRST